MKPVLITLYETLKSSLINVWSYVSLRRIVYWLVNYLKPRAPDLVFDDHCLTFFLVWIFSSKPEIKGFFLFLFLFLHREYFASVHIDSTKRTSINLIEYFVSSWFLGLNLKLHAYTYVFICVKSIFFSRIRF